MRTRQVIVGDPRVQAMHVVQSDVAAEEPQHGLEGSGASCPAERRRHSPSRRRSASRCPRTDAGHRTTRCRPMIIGKDRPEPEHNERVASEPVAETAWPGSCLVLRRGQRDDIPHPTTLEIPGRRVMYCVIVSPAPERREHEQAEDRSEHMVRAPRGQQRAARAIVEHREHAHQKAVHQHREHRRQRRRDSEREVNRNAQRQARNEGFGEGKCAAPCGCHRRRRQRFTPGQTARYMVHKSPYGCRRRPTTRAAGGG